MSSRRYAILGALVVAIAAVVRLVAASNEFWLDEVWSLRIATDLPDAWGVFTLKHDNNHLLNTLYLQWIGLRDAWIIYRLPAVLTGVGTVVLVLACEPAERRVDALIAAILLAVSYPLVLYSAEARGYAPALFCALASFYALERWLERPALALLLAFWIAAVIGILSHGVYLQAYLALLVWSAAEAFRRSGTRALPSLLALHALPLAAAAAFVLFFLRGMVVGGGPGYRTLDVVGETAVYALGLPPWLRATGTMIAGNLALVGLVALVRQRSPRPLFFNLVLVLVPVLVLVVTKPPVLYFRYFLVQVLFLYLLVGAALGLPARRGRLGAVVAVGMVALYVAGQATALRTLLTAGRGGCVETVRYLGTHTNGDEVVVGSDEEFRNPLMLWYFERFLPDGKRFRWVSKESWPAGGPAWLVMHDLGPATPRPDFIRDGQGNRYDRVAGFQCGGVARWYWWVYGRTPGSSP
jgi:hypothetical protein